MVGMMWTGGAALPVPPVSNRRKTGVSVPQRLKGDIDMFTLTRILTLASASVRMLQTARNRSFQFPLVRPKPETCST